MTAANGSRCAQFLSALPTVAAYWICSIGLVFMNKYLLSGAGERIDVPIFVTWYQCVVSMILCFILSCKSRNKLIEWEVPQLRVDLKVCVEIFPYSLVYAAMVVLNNLCLKDIDISFYFTATSLTVIFTSILSYCFFGRKSSEKALLCLGVILLGFAMGVDQENIQASIGTSGAIFGILASLSMATNRVLTSSALVHVKECSWQLIMCHSMNCTIILVPLMFLNGEVHSFVHTANLTTSKYWFVLTASGTFGFVVATPALHNTSVTARAAVQIVLTVLLYNETKTLLWWASNCLVLVGISSYTFVLRNDLDEEFNFNGLAQDKKKLIDHDETNRN